MVVCIRRRAMLAGHPGASVVVAGYADGAVKVYDLVGRFDPAALGCSVLVRPMSSKGCRLASNSHTRVILYDK